MCVRSLKNITLQLLNAEYSILCNVSIRATVKANSNNSNVKQLLKFSITNFVLS
jgi:hypothetical protein